jgi:hypothetical protein
MIVARGLERNLKSAANAAGCEYEVDRTTELARDKITNEADAVSAFGRSCNCGAADLTPYDRQVRRILAEPAVPVHLHTPMGSRQRPHFAAFVTNSWSTIASVWVAATVSLTFGPPIIVFASVA